MSAISKFRNLANGMLEKSITRLDKIEESFKQTLASSKKYFNLSQSSNESNNRIDNLEISSIYDEEISEEEQQILAEAREANAKTRKVVLDGFSDISERLNMLNESCDLAINTLYDAELQVLFSNDVNPNLASVRDALAVRALILKGQTLTLAKKLQNVKV